MILKKFLDKIVKSEVFKWKHVNIIYHKHFMTSKTFCC